MPEDTSPALIKAMNEVIDDGRAGEGVTQITAGEARAAIGLRIGTSAIAVGHNDNVRTAVTNSDGVFQFPNCLLNSRYTISGPGGTSITHTTPDTGSTTEITTPFYYQGA